MLFFFLKTRAFKRELQADGDKETSQGLWHSQLQSLKLHSSHGNLDFKKMMRVLLNLPKQ